MNSLDTISPIDGRYRKYSQPLAKFVSEAALMRYRVMVEGEYLIALSELGALSLRSFTMTEKEAIRRLYELTDDDAQIIHDIEVKGYKHIKATQHDMKAVEYFMKLRLKESTLSDIIEWIHFGLTSYDINTPARGLMLSDALGNVILPVLDKLRVVLEGLAHKYKNLPMLARTHGQPASPTTFGKEFKVFSVRLRKQTEQLRQQKVSVKFSGATGNWNAHVAAYPKVDWIKFSQDFINTFNLNRAIQLEFNPIATQIDPHDSEAQIFDNMRRINTILIDFCQDVWRYISDGWIIQRAVDGEIGSSAMPHKINPLFFENSEGNLGMANAICEFFSRKLPISRLQRDLSDSTVERNFGLTLAHSLVGYEYILRGLERISVDEKKVSVDLEDHPEIIAEAIQTILRREGIAMPYEKLKELTRGQEVTLKDFDRFIEELEVSNTIKIELHKLNPLTYTGLAEKLTLL